MAFETLKAALRGELIVQTDDGYEAARDGLIWNGRKPDAHPHAIVRAASARDVQAVMRFASAEGIRVSARGSGHNFSGIAAQAAIVLDLSALNGVVVEPEAMTAVVGPAVRNGDLAERLAAKGFAFPFGHCADVSLSGYLLGGGIGWNSGEWGVACHSVLSAEVVLADGRLVTASPRENHELYWALRGGGPMFPGVVTSYRLQLQKLRKGMMTSVHGYALDRIDEVARWMEGVAAVAPHSVEFTAILHSAPPPLADSSPKMISAIATVFAESDADANEALEGVALWAPKDPMMVVPASPVAYAELFAGTAQSAPKGARYMAEAAFTDAPRRVFRLLAEALANAPHPACHALTVVFPAGGPAMPDTAFSIPARAIGEMHAVWDDATEDAAVTGWLRATSDAIAPFAKGYYVGGADLARPDRLAQCYSPAAWARLQMVNACYDPRGILRPSCPIDRPGALAIAAE